MFKYISKKTGLDAKVVLIVFVVAFAGWYFVSKAQESMPAIGPTLTLLGNAQMTLVVGDSFVDPGATAVDQENSDVTDQIVKTGTVNTNVVGEYTITYTIGTGELADSKTRTVVVEKKKVTTSGSYIWSLKKPLVQSDTSEPSAQTTENPDGKNANSTSNSTSNSTDKSRSVSSNGGSNSASDNTSPEPAFVFKNNLRVGMNGPEVIELQKRLKKEGYFNGVVGGHFGQITYNAVLKYQIAHLDKIKLSTGFVGEITRAVLNGQL